MPQKNTAGLIIGAGVNVYGEKSGSSKVEGRAKQTAKEIADVLKSDSRNRAGSIKNNETRMKIMNIIKTKIRTAVPLLFLMHSAFMMGCAACGAYGAH